MYNSGWERFVQTGQVCDYLAYKGHQTMENVKNQSENSMKNPYTEDFHTQFCACDPSFAGIGKVRRIAEK